MSRLPFLATALLLLAACGGDGDDEGGAPADAFSCAEETRADDYTAGMEKAGAAGFTVRLADSQPSPPSRGDNTWTVEIVDSAGAPVDDVTIDTRPRMPDHGHGTPKVAEFSAKGAPGSYEITPVNLWMPGYWEVTLSLSGEATDEVTFKFCVD